MLPPDMPLARCECGTELPPVLLSGKAGGSAALYRRAPAAVVYRMACGAEHCPASTPWRGTMAQAAAAWNQGRTVRQAPAALSRVKIGRRGRYWPAVPLPAGVLAVGVCDGRYYFMRGNMAFAATMRGLSSTQNLMQLFSARLPDELYARFYQKGDPRRDRLAAIRARLVIAAAEPLKIDGEEHSRLIDPTLLFPRKCTRAWEFDVLPHGTIRQIDGGRR